MFQRVFVACALLLGVGSNAGCNLNKFAADQTGNIAQAGSDGVNGQWDYELAGIATPSAIMQGEALLSVSPDNETLLIGLARAYVAYSYGWVQDEWERADEAGDFERADHLEARVRLLYQRTTALALRALRQHDGPGKLDEKLKTGKVEIVRAYLHDTFTGQDDVPALYWAGLGWGSSIANAGGDVRELADAPIARAVLERSVELDPSYADAGGLGILASIEGMFPELFGGDLNKAKEMFERAISISKRRNHLLLLGYAKNYAVNAQDKELFISLVREVLDAPDQGTDLRLSNKVARHRAERYIQRVDTWFDPALAK